MPDGPQVEVPPESPLSLQRIQDVLREATADDPRLTLLKGFKLNFSANQDFHKVYFSVRCDCGTAALLSIEVAKSKTFSQFYEAVGGLVEHLQSKAGQFTRMTCEMHERMRVGGRASEGSGQPGPLAG